MGRYRKPFSLNDGQKARIRASEHHAKLQLQSTGAFLYKLKCKLCGARLVAHPTIPKLLQCKRFGDDGKSRYSNRPGCTYQVFEGVV